MLNEDHDYTDTEDEEASFGARTAAADEELMSILKDLRRKIAKQAGQPPYNIFQDPSLEEMAIHYPVTMEELQNITGIGAGKAQRYGGEVIEVIKDYVADKEILRPQDMVVKSVVNKSGLKVYIIQSIDRKMPLEDIADAKGIEPEDLLGEIEAIVSSGTKLNIDYYIDAVIDEDRQQDMYSYFMEEAETGSLDEAIRELAGEFEEEEIRLMRIKVLAEGN
jgi:ATP-dependent DNA helicase RecQ